jgi:SAM-dependent methyltransferase
MIGNKPNNIHPQTVAGFGDEWSRFKQSELTQQERLKIFNNYFTIFNWGALPNLAVGADIGCGSGRWGSIVSERVGELILIDASEDALRVARENLKLRTNVTFLLASVGHLPLEDASLDFAYSLGVLHHVPNTFDAIKEIARVLKSGAPFLIYLYYSFENRPVWFRQLWWISDCARAIISRLPHPLRYAVSQIIATTIYWPLARTASVLDRVGICPISWPLSYYRNKPFYVMRTDALDRFGTQLEQRFTKLEIKLMLEDAGFVDIQFSDSDPYWVAQGFRR